MLIVLGTIEKMQPNKLMKPFLRKLISPFDRRWKRFKLAAEKFIVKTIAKHGITKSYSLAISSESGSGAAVQERNSLPMMESNKLLFAFLKANQRVESKPDNSFQAVAIGNGMMLVGHPHAGFMYADATNVVLLPRLIMKNHQEDTTIALERTISSGDFVMHFGAKQGYHLLTISHLVGPTGIVVAFETSKDFRTLELNVEAHVLEPRTTLISHEIRTSQSLTLLTPSGRNCIVFLSEGTQLDPTTAKSLADYLRINTLATVIDGSKIVSSQDFVAKLSNTFATSFASAA